VITELGYVVRYFYVVPPVPRLMILSFAAVTLAGAVLTAIDGTNAAAAVPILVLQAFGVSTGFAGLARRGYFDLLIARGQPRIRIAVAQWALAALPGLFGWAALGQYHAMRHGGENPFMQSGTAVAFLMASTVPWAASVGLPRFSGAIGWLLLVCLADSGGVIWPDSVHDVIVPVALVGADVSHRLTVVVPAAVLSLASMTAALAWVHRTDIRLEAAQ
jgi:hypothetical protein